MLEPRPALGTLFLPSLLAIFLLSTAAALILSYSFLSYSLQEKEEESTMSVSLFDGQQIPLVGLGTWKSKPGQVESAVSVALDAGYKLIDGAHVYGNEQEVGNALKEKIGAGLNRKDLFIVSKLWNTKHRESDVRPALLNTLKDLQLDYIDLYLIHWPISFVPGDNKFPKNPDGSMQYDSVPPLETWRAMEKLVDEGLVRYIGLSNFNSQQVDEIMSNCRIQPAVLQCEAHPYLNQQRLLDHISKYKIVFQAYSPLGSPDRPWARSGEPVLLDNPTVAEIGKRYNKSVAQVLIRFQVERGVVVIPKSVTPERIRSNFDVFDFKLTQEEMQTLLGLETNWRACLPTIEVDGKQVPRDAGHPHYPFNIPY
ncbi:PREDICTED: alcohol dehydrogenase [NADP(+)]-like [Amphimedon queenslandica]|uniref:alcohol dehydrogenase (NADP(+)) n=1 Tax=Amphimedon queenslandica TaxID=400682 RepID=A0A1X7V191_AMPQE|nr:PREDICTED: alcohol dehydrogenase [NADP(+)]-like [Amphimedon queenslandica]|eukprot:XP_003386238.2 PREDICTED: alcohol dehydrogenase [NADP(+)]-like [Amphimedon queenslandica]